jgi:hypothetical protein
MLVLRTAWTAAHPAATTALQPDFDALEWQRTNVYVCRALRTLGPTRRSSIALNEACAQRARTAPAAPLGVPTALRDGRGVSRAPPSVPPRGAGATCQSQV